MTPLTRLVTRAVAATVLVASLAMGATPALAADGLILSGAITDPNGHLADRTTADNAIEALFNATGSQLYVLLVDTTGGVDPDTYAEGVILQNDLPPQDVLLVIAFDDRTDILKSGPQLDSVLSQTEVDRIRDDIESALGDDDVSGAIVAAASGLVPAIGVAATPTPVPTQTAAPGPTPPPGSSSGGSGGSGGISIVPILLVLIVVGIVIWVVRRVRRGPAGLYGSAEENRMQEQIGREANRLLIDTDDALRDADQELGFAEAQFGAAQAAPLAKALASARDELKKAFGIGQELDDTIPEPAERRRQMLQEIVDICKRARASVDEQQAAIQALRGMEKQAPEVVAALPATIAAVEARMPAARGAMERLKTFAESAWSAVKGNLDAATARIADARTHLAASEAALTTSDRSAAASAARMVQVAAAEAGTLLDAIDKAVASLEELQGKVQSAITAADVDLQAARQAPAGGPLVSPAELAKAQASLDAARHAASSTPPDPVAALREATTAQAMTAHLLAGVRAADEQRQRATQTARTAVGSASASIDAARQYLDGYRSTASFGRRARNRLVEAERYFAEARQAMETDPASAVQLARTADALADEALASARQDAGEMYPAQPPTGHGSGGSPGSSAGGGSVGSGGSGGGLGSVLGGILGGGNGGGWPDDGWGSSGGPSLPSSRGGGWSGGGHSSRGGFGSGGFGGGSRSGWGGGGRSSSGKW